MSFRIRCLFSLWFLALSSPAISVTSTPPFASDTLHLAASYRSYQPLTAFELISELPGAMSTPSLLSQQELYVRGLPQKYTRILINGFPLSGTASQQYQLLRRVPASMIHSISVDHSNHADQEWNGGAAATINLILEQPGIPLKWQTSASGPDAGGFQSIAAGTRRWLAAVGGGRMQETVSGQLSGRYWKKQQLSQPISALLAWQGAENSNIQWNSQLLLGKTFEHQVSQDVPVDRRLDLEEPSLSDGRQSRNLHQLRFQTAGQLDDVNTRFKFGGTTELLSQSDHSPSVQDDTINRQFSGHVSMEELLDEHRWKAGLRYQHQSQQGSGQAQGMSRTQQLAFIEYKLAAFVQDRWSLTEATEMETGLRMESYEITQTRTADTRHSQIATGTHWMPSLRVTSVLNPHHTISVGLSQSVRQPETHYRLPFEFQIGSQLWSGNAELDDEVISTSELHWRYSGERTQHSGSSWDLALFQRSIVNLIHYQLSDSGEPGHSPRQRIQPVNSDGIATLRGLEAGVHFNTLVRAHPVNGNVHAGLYRSAFGNETDTASGFRLNEQPQYWIKAKLSTILNEHQNLALELARQGNQQLQAIHDDAYVSEDYSALWRIGLHHQLRVTEHVSLFSLAALHSPESLNSDYKQFRLGTHARWRFRVTLSGRY